MATIQDFITPEAVSENYNQIVAKLREIADLEQNKLSLEIRRETLWAQLLDVPGFKPGRSNMEKDAKLREADSDLMTAYDTNELELHNANLDLSVLHEKKSYINRLIDYFEILGE